MITTPIIEGEEGIRRIVRQWIDLLAEDHYEEALALLYVAPDKRPGQIVPENGPHWTAEELRTVIAYYGNYDDAVMEEGEPPFRVVPVTDKNRQQFERWLRVGLTRDDLPRWLDSTEYAAMAHVDLPLDVGD